MALRPPLAVGLRALGLGDFCTAVPAWRRLREALPDHRLVLAAPAWQRDLVHLCPPIDQLVSVGALQPLPPALMGADLAVNLHGHGPQSTDLLAAAHPRRLVAFAAPGDVEGTAPVWDAGEHDVARWCRLVEAIGASPAEPDLTLDRPPVPPPVPRATLVHPGAAAPARRWPAERWARVIDALAEAGHRIVLTGSTAEQHLTGHVAAMAGSSVLDLGGRTSVIELAALVADARLVLCGDTGVAHLASAYAVPSVVLFGPTSPATWGPPPSGPHVALWSGSTGDPHGSTPDPGLVRIDVARVLGAVEAVVGARPTANR